MARNRPGKRERLNAARDAFQRDRAAIMAANAWEQRPEPLATRGVGPMGFRQSITARDNLRGASHTQTFAGPRGFHTPKDTLSRAETVKPSQKEVRLGLLAPSRRSQEERESAKALAATVNLSRPTQKN
jgi:hypothetical protein